ncbi:MAG: hypothetical protein ACKN9M_05805, partial [Burkholderiaceae bacterium]
VFSAGSFNDGEFKDQSISEVQIYSLRTTRRSAKDRFIVYVEILLPQSARAVSHFIRKRWVDCVVRDPVIKTSQAG